MEGLVGKRHWLARIARIAFRASLLPVLLLGGLWLYGHSLTGSYAFTGTPGSQAPAPTLVLHDDQGQAFNLVSQHGKIVLVYFGYTSCPDVCPLTLAQLQKVMNDLGHDATHVEQVFVTLDPQRDRPAVLREYLDNFTPAPLGLTGSPAAIAQAARAWGITWRREPNGFINHSSLVTVVGPAGKVRLRYGFAQLNNPAAVARDLKHLWQDG